MTAQALNHFLNHVICSYANAILQQLHRQVAIAEMPGDANHLAFVMRVDLQQLFGPGADLHDAAIVQCQSIAVAQPDGLRQIKQ